MTRLIYLYAGKASFADPEAERLGAQEYQLSKSDFQVVKERLLVLGYTEGRMNDFDIELRKQVSGCPIQVGMFEGTVCFYIPDDPNNGGAVHTARIDALDIAKDAGFSCYDENAARWLAIKT